MKYKSCTRVIYNTFLERELFLTAFGAVSQEITTSFCERWREGVNWMIESSPTLVVMQRFGCGTL